MAESSSCFKVTQASLNQYRRNDSNKCRRCSIEFVLGDEIYRHNKRSGKKYHKKCAEIVGLV